MILSLLGGFILLLLGGEFLVRGASGLASRLGVPALVVGIIIVGFGTSAPELVTSIEAALNGAPGLAVGNIIGSNIANILLILGAGSLIYPMACSRDSLFRDGGLVIGTALLLAAAGYAGGLTRMIGIAFIAGLALYMWFLFTRERRKAFAVAALAGHDSPPIDENCPVMWKCVVFTVAGMVSIILGGKFLVDGGIALAKAWGVAEEIIGLTIIAIGTSLPELATTVVAALRRHSEIALGNVLGSNVYNVLGIGGATATISPLAISPEVMRLDIPLMVGLSIGMVAIGAYWNGLSRWIGVAFLGGYGAYVAMLLS
ncbi:MAG: calcium/sodium antiporter [Hyphomicrobiales bacterium]|nr:calcium/sodium antiporter [Hyphomicrobiales bacterium]